MLRLISRLVRFIVLFIAIFAFVMFSLENKESINLSLYPTPYTLDIAKYAALLLAFGFGYVLAIWHGIFMVRRQRSITREYRTRNKSLESEITMLKMKETPSQNHEPASMAA